jgi:hypothetical protein
MQRKRTACDAAFFGELARCCENWATSKADSSESCLGCVKTTLVLEPPPFLKNDDVLILLAMQGKREPAANGERPNVRAGSAFYQVASRHEQAENDFGKLLFGLVGRGPAPVWDVSANHHIEPKKPIPYVNHYSFQILDPDWAGKISLA